MGTSEWPTQPGEWTIGQVVWNPRWTPPGGWAESSVMEIVTSWSDFTFDDFDEVRSLPRRTFVINIVRRPWVRSLDPVIIEAQARSSASPPP